MISIIIPMFNSEKYIEKCIESISKNSYKNIEIIVVDDGSTDDSINIVKKYKNIKLLYSDHAGPGNARNIGIENASGDYIFFLDSDDTINPNTLKVLKHNIENYDIVIGNYNIIYDNSNIELFETPTDSKFNSFFESVTIWNRLYKKNFLNKNKIIFESIYQGEDRLFLAELYLCNPKINIISDCIYNWIRHEKESQKTLTHIDDETNFNGQLYCMKKFKNLLENNVSANDRKLLFEHLQYSCIYLKEILNMSRKKKCNLKAFEEFVLSLEFDKNTELYKKIFGKEWNNER